MLKRRRKSMETDRRSNLYEENLVYLRSWAGATEREIQDVIDQIAPLEQRAERLRERLDLITRLGDLVESDLRGSEPATTIDLTEGPEEEQQQEEDSSAEPKVVVEGLRQIFDVPS
jgi:hypothetical protein